jgi:UDP-2,4-diacetamido-2,4,6-trideoxy-beta-L-altropyranose hydrolase
MTKSVLFRADSSLDIGSGHVTRCKTLADELRSRGWRTGFLARAMSPQHRQSLQRAGHDVHHLSTEYEDELLSVAASLQPRASAFVVDHYEIGEQWHAEAGAATGAAVAAIDDLADRPHGVDLLLNQNLGHEASEYASLVPRDCVVLVGPTYALVRPDFRVVRSARRQRDRIRHVLVFISGADKHRLTEVMASEVLSLGLSLDLVVGSLYPGLRELQYWAAGHAGVGLHVDTAEMAALMLRADVAIGAPSSASWERCCVGLPSLLVTIAPNQVRVADALDKAGIARHLGWWTEVEPGEVGRALEGLGGAELIAMSRLGRALVDGRGVQRVATHLQRLVAARAA